MNTPAFLEQTLLEQVIAPDKHSQVRKQQRVSAGDNTWILTADVVVIGSRAGGSVAAE